MTVIITTPLYYVNDKAHLGSTYTTIACDTLARFYRLKGKTVSFITGVDEHGQKIQQKAAELNINPKDHCDAISSEYEELWNMWNISYDYFARTTSKKHISFVESFFNKVKERGDIKLARQEGWYCVGCEEYKDIKTDEENPKCSIHNTFLQWKDEENLFFKLSNYQNQIEQLVQSETFIEPVIRRNEIIKFVENGLKDFSISRVNVDWGIPVPGYKGHTFYVWFDALLGYISSQLEDNNADIDSLNADKWPASVHIIGKDILRFHAIYWPAMLMSAGLKTPQKVFGHGFLTREGQKMGKSLGNVIEPKELLDNYGEDAVRWYLLKDIQFGQDGDFQNKRFIDVINNDLANTIGNLVNRTVTMSMKWFNNNTPEIIDTEDNKSILQIKVEESIPRYLQNMESIQFHKSTEIIMELASSANLYLNDNEPWKKIKDISNKKEVSLIIYNVLETSRIIGLLLLPILPRFSRSILTQLAIDMSNSEFDKQLRWGLLSRNKPLPKPLPLFSKLESNI